MTSSDRSPVWVIGADGLLGGALARALWLARVPMQATTRRREQVAGWVRFLDLAEVDGFDPGGNPGVVYLCGAVTDMQRCEADPAGTRSINVNGVCRLAERCADRGAHLIFLSSSAVFSGRSNENGETSPLDPTSEYGRQKAQAEAQLARLGAGLAIVRMTKVLSAEMCLLRQWRETLERGQIIQPYVDLLIAPVSLRHAVAALIDIGSARHCGVFHLSGRRDVNYAEFARRYSQAIGADADLVHPQPVKGLAYHPRHATLDMSATTASTGIQAQPLDKVFADLVREQRASLTQTVL
jgi:dTDP-4-dehydrorhamnose reductase